MAGVHELALASLSLDNLVQGYVVSTGVWMTVVCTATQGGYMNFYFRFMKNNLECVCGPNDACIYHL